MIWLGAKGCQGAHQTNSIYEPSLLSIWLQKWLTAPVITNRCLLYRSTRAFSSRYLYRPWNNETHRLSMNSILADNTASGATQRCRWKRQWLESHSSSGHERTNKQCEASNTRTQCFMMFHAGFCVRTSGLRELDSIHKVFTNFGYLHSLNFGLNSLLLNNNFRVLTCHE